MLPKSKRLTSTSLDVVMEKGRAIHSPLFVMRYLGGEKDTRLSAVVPQKVVKTAAGRNSLRRKMYESVRKLIQEVEPGTHIIIFAKSPAILADQKALEADTRVLFVKAGLLR